MKKVQYILFVLAILLGSTCEPESNVTPDSDNYLIFGRFYGFCRGEECNEIFKLTHKNLFEDTANRYRQTNFHFVPLENDKFEKVKDLPDAFPEQLLNDTTPMFGCPDCADGGGLFIQYAKDGKVRSWEIDLMKNNVPKYLHPFMDQVTEKIQLINSE